MTTTTSSRETELKHPIHVVCLWLGNTPEIAVKHYLRVIAADFEAATAGGSRSRVMAGIAKRAGQGIVNLAIRNPTRLKYDVPLVFRQSKVLNGGKFVPEHEEDDR